MQEAISALLASTEQVTNLNPGSLIRSIMDASSAEDATIEQEIVDQMASGILQAPYQIWQVVPEGAIPSQYSLQWSLSASAPSAVTIPSGQMAFISGSNLQWATNQQATVSPGSSVNVIGVCQTPGAISNVPAGTITSIQNSPSPYLTVTNPSAQPVVAGADAETQTQTEARLRNKTNSVHKGDDGAVELAALQAVVTDSAGNVLEQVLKDKSVDDLTPGKAWLYAWNGVGDMSSNLQAAIAQQLTGYTDSNGVKHVGGKAAGVQYTITNVIANQQDVAGQILPQSGWTFSAVNTAAQDAISQFFSDLDVEDGMSTSQLIFAVLGVPGVADFLLTAPAASLPGIPTVADPTIVPTVTAVTDASSTYAAGSYDVAYTFTNAWGQTLATGTSSVTLASGQGIQVSAITLATGATGVNYYVSTTAGGSTLGYAGNSTGAQTVLNSPGDSTQPPASNTAIIRGNLYTLGQITLTEMAS